MDCPHCGQTMSEKDAVCVECGEMPVEQTQAADPIDPPVEGVGEILREPSPTADRAEDAEVKAEARRPAIRLRDTARPLTCGQFLAMELVALLPLVNLVVFCVMAFQKKGNTNRVEWARAKLLGMLICLTLLLLLAITVMLLMMAGVWHLIDLKGLTIVR